MTLTDERPLIALAGNPNVGKSSVFNSLTGMHQHTGNWTGKTVATAQGVCRSAVQEYRLVDIPGTYSLLAHSVEEEVARDFLCFDSPDAVVVVCDATCLERNLNLVLQITELTPYVLVCLNLMDEAERKGIRIHAERLSEQLGLPVVTTVAHRKRSVAAVTEALDSLLQNPPTPPPVSYPVAVESAVAQLLPHLPDIPHRRWAALRLLEQDEVLTRSLTVHYGELPLDVAQQALTDNGLTADTVRDHIVGTLMHRAAELTSCTVTHKEPRRADTDNRIDRFLTDKRWGYPLMLLLPAVVFWLTVQGANYPSQWLGTLLFGIEDLLTALFTWLHAPSWLHGALIEGAFRVLAWVVSVMLPPMAIFFPLFTLLEDVGYLPRLAYNLDRPFRRCRACGKQALTMCMGFGCNAAGVTGCRIIDSPRERLLAILTNCFVPCNGRFPTLIALLTVFFAGSGNTLLSVLLLTTVILFSIGVTFAVTRLLSATVLRGTPSSFTLELPPYRRPRFGHILVRSLLDRTVFVLGRAAAVAAPAGLLLWILANVTVNGSSLLTHTAAFLDPLGQLMGLDGAILLAFILGFPANEIVIPIVIMIYLSQGTLTDTTNLFALKEVLVSNGWTWTTAVCTILFSLMHWPCSTTLLTIRKETGSKQWTLLAFLLPTALGITACILFNALV